MKLNVTGIPDNFKKAIPKGIRLVRRMGSEFLLVESLYCPKGHNLLVDSVRIHDEASIKLKIHINDQEGILFLDAFWGSHAKLFSFVPVLKKHTDFQAFCPYCDIPLRENILCSKEGCGSEYNFILYLPGGRNRIHICSRLSCPGHFLEVVDLPHKLVETVSRINFFGEGEEDVFGGV